MKMKFVCYFNRDVIVCEDCGQEWTKEYLQGQAGLEGHFSYLASLATAGLEALHKPVCGIWKIVR